ncbi:major facilitator superfamily domain-containing protein [Lipomyces arxii]|uniref:major facilitator superfamily domain-containing protein n=1 Tax=Lipomyces arxii TaxID=56418 RepID=UPI0034CF11AB
MDPEKTLLASTSGAETDAMDYGSISTVCSREHEHEHDQEKLLTSVVDVKDLEDSDKPFAGYGELQALLDEGPSSWTLDEERRVRRKTDIRVMTWACMMFFSLQLNRINIVNVLTTDFLMDVHMEPNDYNLAQTIFVTCFLLFEIPTQIMTTIMGPEIWIPTMMTLWASVGFLQTFVTSKTTYLITRGFLGVCEGGFVPGLVLYTTSFYKSNEMSVRLALLWTTNYLTNVISALLASVIFKMDGINGWHDWQWLFFLEGILTISIGISTFFLLPSFRRSNISGFFTPREQAVLRARVILDDPSKARALESSKKVNLGKFQLRDVFNTLTDKFLFPIFILGFLGFVPSVAAYQFLTIMFRSFGYGTLESNLLVIPANVLLILCMLTASHFADKYRRRWWVPIVAMAWCLPFVIILLALPDETSRWVRVFCITFIVGFPYYTPILMSWISANSNDQHKRALAVAIYNIGVQFGNITSANVYRSDDAPYYRRGNAILIGIGVFVIGLALFVRWMYKNENRRREAVWNGMTELERLHYSATTTDRGNRRLDFRLKL